MKQREDLPPPLSSPYYDMRTYPESQLPTSLFETISTPWDVLAEDPEASLDQSVYTQTLSAEPEVSWGNAMLPLSPELAAIGSRLENAGLALGSLVIGGDGAGMEAGNGFGPYEGSAGPGPGGDFGGGFEGGAGSASLN